MDTKIEIENSKKGKDLKRIYLEKMGKTNEKIRLFCIGQEVEDDAPLHKYNFVNGYVMICHVAK